MFFNGIMGAKNPNRKMIPKSLAEPILAAILEDDANKLGELISNLEDVNSAFHLYNKKLPDILSANPTMLCICCFFSSIECFNLIRDLDGNIKEDDDFGRNCFHFATAGGSLKMMRILDQSNTDNVKSNDANNNNNNTQNDDSSSDDDAIFIGRGFFRRSFLRKNFFEFEDSSIYNKRDDRGLTPMHYGAMFGHLDVIRYIWTKGAQLDKIHDFQGNRPIHLACLYGHTNVVKFFVENGVKFESDKQSNKLQPIHYACIGGYIDTIEYLISLNADINLMANSKTPIFYAARYGSLGAVKLLVKHGATFKFKRRKNSPIVEAALGGHADVINYFLKKGCDPNVYTSTGETPLMAAINGNNPEVVKLLIKNGAKISFEPFSRKKSNSAKSANEESNSDDENASSISKRIQKARKERNERKRKMALLDKEIVDINSFNLKDTTDLLIAASRKGNIEIFNLILQNVDIQKYIESDEEITNRKKKVNKEMYQLLLEEKKQEEMQRKRRFRIRVGLHRFLNHSDSTGSDDDDDDDNSDDVIESFENKAKEEEEEVEEEEEDEDRNIFRKLCSLGYYTYGSFEDANIYSDPNCGKIYQLFSNAVDYRSLELLKILIENKLIPKETTKFYIRMANEGDVDMLNYMLDKDIPFNKTDSNLKKEIFNLGKIEILEKFRQKGLKLDINNDIGFLSRIISTYDPELLTYVLDKIYVGDTKSKPKPPTKIKRKKRKSYFWANDYQYDDFSYNYAYNNATADPINTVLSKCLQYSSAASHSILRRSLYSRASISCEKKALQNEENLRKILNILLDRGFKFNPKGLMFSIPSCVSLKEIQLLLTLMQEIEKRDESEKLNFEKLKLVNIIYLLEEYDLPEYIEFLDFLFDRNFSLIPKEKDQKTISPHAYEEVDSSFSSVLRTILLKNKYNNRISSLRQLSRFGILTDSSDDDYFYDNDYLENFSKNVKNDEDDNDNDNADKSNISNLTKEKEREKNENDKVIQTELNLINYMLNHGTPILDRSLRLIEKVAHKANNMELIKLAFKNLVLLDRSYKRDRYIFMSVNEEHKTPLELACKRGYYDVVVDLVQRGANVNESGFKDYSSPLMFAMMSKNEQLIQFLQSKGAKVPANNPSCLPKLMKERDRWLSGIRPRYYDSSRSNMFWQNRYKRKENKQQENKTAKTNIYITNIKSIPAPAPTASNTTNISTNNANKSSTISGSIAFGAPNNLNQNNYTQPLCNTFKETMNFQCSQNNALPNNNNNNTFNNKSPITNSMPTATTRSMNVPVYSCMPGVGGVPMNFQTMNNSMRPQINNTVPTYPNMQPIINNNHNNRVNSTTNNLNMSSSFNSAAMNLNLKPQSSNNVPAYQNMQPIMNVSNNNSNTNVTSLNANASFNPAAINKPQICNAPQIVPNQTMKSVNPTQPNSFNQSTTAVPATAGINFTMNQNIPTNTNNFPMFNNAFPTNSYQFNGSVQTQNMVPSNYYIGNFNQFNQNAKK